MKKKIKIGIIICGAMIFLVALICEVVVGLNHKNRTDLKGTDLLENHGDVVFSIIKRGNGNDCVKVELALYEDNQYELFTDYATCKPGKTCTMELRYTKSIKGTYDYDLNKIINASTNANEKLYSMDNLPEYEITLGEKYIKKYNTLTFTVEKNQTNNYLDELLKQIDINLDQCANQDYVK